eukprot:1261351-Prymnesium_polylepis.1
MEAVATVAAVRTTAGAARASKRAAMSCPLTESAERGTVRRSTSRIKPKSVLGAIWGSASGDGREAGFRGD